MTTTLPLVAPAGTGVTMLVADQVVGVALVPLNVTVLVPFVAPKFVPVIVTTVPTGPLVGERLVSVGATVVTVKASVLLARPPTVTTTLPLVAPLGTGTTMLAADQLVGVARRPVERHRAGPLGRAEVGAGEGHDRPGRPARRRQTRQRRRHGDREGEAVAREPADRDHHVAARGAGSVPAPRCSLPTRSSASRSSR